MRRARRLHPHRGVRSAPNESFFFHVSQSSNTTPIVRQDCFRKIYVGGATRRRPRNGCHRRRRLAGRSLQRADVDRCGLRPLLRPVADSRGAACRGVVAGRCLGSSGFSGKHRRKPGMDARHRRCREGRPSTALLGRSGRGLPGAVAETKQRRRSRLRRHGLTIHADLETLRCAPERGRFQRRRPSVKRRAVSLPPANAAERSRAKDRRHDEIGRGLAGG